jgi:hypothetical protein
VIVVPLFVALFLWIIAMMKTSSLSIHQHAMESIATVYAHSLRRRRRLRRLRLRRQLVSAVNFVTDYLGVLIYSSSFVMEFGHKVQLAPVINVIKCVLTDWVRVVDAIRKPILSVIQILEKVIVIPLVAFGGLVHA